MKHEQRPTRKNTRHNNRSEKGNELHLWDIVSYQTVNLQSIAILSSSTMANKEEKQFDNRSNLTHRSCSADCEGKSLSSSVEKEFRSKTQQRSNINIQLKTTILNLNIMQQSIQKQMGRLHPEPSNCPHLEMMDEQFWAMAAQLMAQ
jgi:hypothetical protein